MTKQELFEALNHIPEDSAISAAIITWGDIDLKKPELMDVYQYIDKRMIRNIPDNINEINNQLITLK